jgi:hypothetical protein
MSDDRRERPRLPAERAFVVMLSADCRPGQDEIRGRVEHVRSGRATHFASIAELIVFLAALTSGDDALV